MKSLRLGLLILIADFPAAAQPAEKVLSLPGGHSMAFRWVPPGTFERGSPESEAGRDADEGPVHRVTLTRGFYLGTFEVTQAQWLAVIGQNPAVFQQGDEPLQRPVESVSWQEASRFLARLNTLGRGKFRLPTEAEWEYAARAGSSTRYPWGDSPRDYEVYSFAWVNSRSYGSTQPVGKKPPNAWGLHDMVGNAWEWCADWYGPYAAGPQVDPQGPASGTEKIFRGGSWYDFPVSLRVANRHRHRPDGRYSAIGFRVLWEEGRTATDDPLTVRLPGGVPIPFVSVPAGNFVMGSPEAEAGRQRDEGPLREVAIPRPFLMGQHEVTQGQWRAVMSTNPSVFARVPDADLHPVEMVSWNDIQLFLQKLNAMGVGRFRLPTEAEWEYACRAGNSARFPWGDDPQYRGLAEHAWFYSRAEGRSHPVGTRKPNPLGLFDMNGNVWEWVADAGPDGKGRGIRGGSWFNEPEALRCANRHQHPPDSRQTNIGFRLVREP